MTKKKQLKKLNCLTLSQNISMKRWILLMTASFYCIWLQAQTKMNCCSPTRQFAMLAMNQDFRAAHHAPVPFVFRDARGKMISFATAGGKTAHAYFVKSPVASENYLLVFHEWWGLNDYIKQMCDKLQHDLGNINVIAPDLYDGKVATTSAEAGKYMQAVTDGRARAIIRGALKYAGPGSRIYTIGWCFGGGWSLQASLMADNRAEGCVMYYGLPETNIDTLRTLHCDVLGLFANKDGWITPKVVDTFVSDMKKAGKKLIVHRYDDVHGFANPSNPKHDEAATQNAYGHALQFLKARIKH
jgi:carboxymethylenebutenolidase